MQNNVQNYKQSSYFLDKGHATGSDAIKHRTGKQKYLKHATRKFNRLSSEDATKFNMLKGEDSINKRNFTSFS